MSSNPCPLNALFKTSTFRLWTNGNRRQRAQRFFPLSLHKSLQKLAMVLTMDLGKTRQTLFTWRFLKLPFPCHSCFVIVLFSNCTTQDFIFQLLGWGWPICKELPIHPMPLEGVPNNLDSFPPMFFMQYSKDFCCYLHFGDDHVNQSRRKDPCHLAVGYFIIFPQLVDFMKLTGFPC